MRHGLEENHLGFRWMDDAAHVVDVDAPVGVIRVVKRLTRRATYGRGLQLMRTRGVEAFGFRWHVDHGRVEVEQELKWIRGAEKYHGISAPDSFYEAQQLDAHSGRVGVLAGYVLRMADCSSPQEEAFKSRLQRLFLEMQRKGHPDKS